MYQICGRAHKASSSRDRGNGSNATYTTIDMSKEAVEDGVDGLLIVTPYYNKATQNGLIAHYKAVASEAKAPIIMYSVASRTG